MANDPIPSVAEASRPGLDDILKLAILAAAVYQVYQQYFVDGDDKKSDAPSELLSEKPNLRFLLQLPISVLLATFVAINVWFFGFSALVAAVTFVTTIASIQLIRSIRSWFANKSLEKFNENKKAIILNKTVNKERLSAEEMAFNRNEPSELQKMGMEDADSWFKYAEHFLVRNTWAVPILGGSAQNVQEYYSGWARLRAQRNSASSVGHEMREKGKGKGKEEEKGENTSGSLPRFDTSMFANGKLIEDEDIAAFARLMDVSVKIYQTMPSTYAIVGAYLENCSFHCIIHFIFSKKDADLKSMFVENPVYPLMLNAFYKKYGLQKSEDQNVNIDNFIALLRIYSHPRDREIFLGQFFREFFIALKESNEFPQLNVSISDSFAITYSSEEDVLPEQEVLSMYHTENGGGHFYIGYGNKELNSEHNEKLKSEGLLSWIMEIVGTKERDEYLKKAVQEKYNDIKPPSEGSCSRSSPRPRG